MKLTISEGDNTLIELKHHHIQIPDDERSRAECMMILSEALVLLANACNADEIEDEASEMSDAIRRGIDSRLKAAGPEPGLKH